MSRREKILRINNDTEPLGFVIRFPKGKTITSIDDIIFLVKEYDSDPLDQALVEKYLSTGEITVANKDLAFVQFSVADYDTMEVDVLYRAGLFCKWIGSSDFDENVEHVFDFQLEQDFHNNN